MTDKCPTVNRNGLFIPEPILVAFFNMKYLDIGQVVYHMLQWTHGLSITQSNLESMSWAAGLVNDIWKGMVRQECGKADPAEAFPGGADDEA